ncbi:hypothetical protein IFM89_038844 [Coptis chinensis]|uniref:DUF4283 domain-containing protein n=1 Tax=Coptis chinensis TaxID=261450 RepID=A0A835I8G5_9MAGN|nr:hypothetical protein IFM89_038844 [Coptis chinensis]
MENPNLRSDVLLPLLLMVLVKVRTCLKGVPYVYQQLPHQLLVVLLLKVLTWLPNLKGVSSAPQTNSSQPSSIVNPWSSLFKGSNPNSSAALKGMDVDLVGVAKIPDYIINHDMRQVLEDDPMHITGNLFVIRQWSQEVEAQKSKIKTLPVWVKLMNLPKELWTDDGLSYVASLIAKVTSVWAVKKVNNKQKEQHMAAAADEVTEIINVVEKYKAQDSEVNSISTAREKPNEPIVQDLNQFQVIAEEEHEEEDATPMQGIGDKS